MSTKINSNAYHCYKIHMKHNVKSMSKKGMNDTKSKKMEIKHRNKKKYTSGKKCWKILS